MGRRNDPNRCPECRERVRPMAAGCANCGATLDPRRFQQRSGQGTIKRLGSSISASLQYGGGGTRRPRNLAPDWKERPLKALFILVAVFFLISLVFSLLSFVVYRVL